MALLYSFARLSLFFLFTFLFILFCFSSLYQKVVLLNLLDTNVNPISYYFPREKERESPKSSREEGGGVGWCDGAG